MQGEQLLRQMVKVVQEELNGFAVRSYPIYRDGQLKNMISVHPKGQEPNPSNGTAIDISYVVEALEERRVSVDFAAKQIVKMYRISQGVETMNRDDILDNVILNVNHQERHQKKYQDMNIVSQPWLDLVLIYVLIIKTDKSQSAFVLNEQLIRDAGLTLAEVHKAAVRNTSATTQVNCLDATDIALSSLLYSAARGMQDVDRQIELIYHSYQAPNIVMASVFSLHDAVGAAVLLDAEAFQEISKVMQSNLYVVPFGDQELLVFKAGSNTEEDQAVWETNLKQTISLMNERLIPDEDILSNSLYYYEADTGSFMLL